MSKTGETKELRVIRFHKDEPIKLPRNYGCLPKGNAYKTRKAKELTRQAGKDFYEKFTFVKSGGRYLPKTISYHIPKTILSQVIEAERETQEGRESARLKAQESRERRHQKDLVRLAGRVGDLFPRLPEAERIKIVSRAFEVGSERVGRTSKLDEDRKLELAVIAHARHSRTEYDELMDAGWAKIDVRQHIRDHVTEIVECWREA